MILFDTSALFHKTVHHLVKQIKTNPKQFQHVSGMKIDLKRYKTEFYLLMINQIEEFKEKFSAEFGQDVILVLDDKSGKGNWRKRLYPQYKAKRAEFRESFSDFDYSDAYEIFNEFLSVLEETNVYDVLGVAECEADDIILVLGADNAEKFQPTLILSPDKDFIQLQKYPNVKQFSWLTNKWVQISDKDETLDGWLIEHICLGDIADNVPRIVDFKELNESAIPILQEKYPEFLELTPFQISSRDYNYLDFDDVGGLFKKEKFGKATLKKQIAKFDSFQDFLKSDPVLEQNYFRNKQLVLIDGIPEPLKKQILMKKSELSEDRNVEKFIEKLELAGKENILPQSLQNQILFKRQLTGLFDF